MMTEEALEKWLISKNEGYRSADVPPLGRPFLAMRDFSIEFKAAVAFNSPLAQKIHVWFKAHTQPGAHALGPLFTGAYYFDACFWPLHIPIPFGMPPRISPFDCLETMPPSLKGTIGKSPRETEILVRYWVDCCDFGYGFDDIEKLGNVNALAKTFMQNGHRELTGAIAQLVTPRPNSKAILALRMATEIFLKALLIQERNLADEKQVKKLSHELDDTATECFKTTQVPDFEEVAKLSAIFPKVPERYTGTEWKLPVVWEAARVTQIAASAVMRRYSNRDMRSQI